MGELEFVGKGYLIYIKRENKGSVITVGFKTANLINIFIQKTQRNILAVMPINK